MAQATQCSPNWRKGSWEGDKIYLVKGVNCRGGGLCIAGDEYLTVARKKINGSKGVKGDRSQRKSRRGERRKKRSSLGPIIHMADTFRERLWAKKKLLDGKAGVGVPPPREPSVKGDTLEDVPVIGKGGGTYWAGGGGMRCHRLGGKPESAAVTSIRGRQKRGKHGTHEGTWSQPALHGHPRH